MVMSRKPAASILRAALIAERRPTTTLRNFRASAPRPAHDRLAARRHWRRSINFWALLSERKPTYRPWSGSTTSRSTRSTTFELKRQAARCMDCGTPFCQTHTRARSTTPRLTTWCSTSSGRRRTSTCRRRTTSRSSPARLPPCGSCVAGLVDQSVTIKNMEYNIIDKAWGMGWVKPRPPKVRSGKAVAVVTSGGRAADEPTRSGHMVTGRADPVPGGLLTYGIPNMKLDKETVSTTHHSPHHAPRTTHHYTAPSSSRSRGGSR